MHDIRDGQAKSENERQEGGESFSAIRSATTRRDYFWQSVLAGAATITAFPQFAAARFVLDEDTGEYVEVDEVDWQTAWKDRLEKASSMSRDEIFQAARGAGNTDLREGPESDASKKRRAMSACRDAAARSKVGGDGISVRDCTARVLAGEVDFVLEAL